MYYPIVHCLVFLPFASKKTIGRDGGFGSISHYAGILPDYHNIFPLDLGVKQQKARKISLPLCSCIEKYVIGCLAITIRVPNPEHYLYNHTIDFLLISKMSIDSFSNNVSRASVPNLFLYSNSLSEIGIANTK